MSASYMQQPLHPSSDHEGPLVLFPWQQKQSDNWPGVIAADKPCAVVVAAAGAPLASGHLAPLQAIIERKGSSRAGVGWEAMALGGKSCSLKVQDVELPASTTRPQQPSSTSQHSGHHLFWLTAAPVCCIGKSSTSEWCDPAIASLQPWLTMLVVLLAPLAIKPTTSHGQAGGVGQPFHVTAVTHSTLCTTRLAHCCSRLLYRGIIYGRVVRPCNSIITALAYNARCPIGTSSHQTDNE
jgi:hypothetical protein